MKARKSNWRVIFAADDSRRSPVVAGIEGAFARRFLFPQTASYRAVYRRLYCAKAKLVIEFDGQIHERDDHPQRDVLHDQWFAERGIETMRISAADIMADAHDVSDGVVRYVRDKLKSR